MRRNFPYSLGSFAVLLTILFSAFVLTAMGQTKKGSAEKIDICEVLGDLPNYLDREMIVDARYQPGLEVALLKPLSGTCPHIGSVHPEVKYVRDPDFERNTDAGEVKRFLRRIDLKKGIFTRSATGTFLVTLRRYTKRNPLDTEFDYELVMLKAFKIR